MFSLLKSNPRFLRFWISNWFSEMADWLRNTTLMFVVMDLSHGSAVAMSINMFCEYAPVFILGFLVGVFADRWDKKRTLMSAFIVRALIMIGIVFAIRMESMALIYMCSIISAIGTLLFRSSQSAFIMQFVAKEDRPLATSMRQMASSVLALIGAGIATFFYKLWGAGASLSIAAMLFVVVLPILASIKVEYTALPPKESGQKLRSILDDFKSGFHYCWNHRTVRPMLLALLMFGINAGVSNVLMIFALTEFFHLPKETLAYTAPLEGVTMLLVSLLLPKLKYRQENMVAYSVMMLGGGTAVMVFTHIFAIGLIGLVIVVSGVVAFNNSTNTLSQTTTDFEYQGRLNMIFQAAWMGPMVILMVTAGWLHSLFSIQAILLTTGAVITVCGVLLYRVYQRQKATEQPTTSHQVEVGHDQVAKA